jgi:protein-S-isoprenylcysteine O-methyltransferase Ste14
MTLATYSAIEAAMLLSQHFEVPFKGLLLDFLLRGRSVADTCTMPPPFFLGWAFITAGSLVRLYCYRKLGRMYTYNITVCEDHKLITSGPYAYVRHPGYTGGLTSLPGIMLFYFGPGSWLKEAGWLGGTGMRACIMLWTIVNTFGAMLLVARTWKEDAIMKKKFGEEWEKWAVKVPYRLFPGLF